MICRSQDLNYQKYIFGICLYTVGELGVHKSVQMAYLWIMKSNTSTIQQVVTTNTYVILMFYI